MYVQCLYQATCVILIKNINKPDFWHVVYLNNMIILYFPDKWLLRIPCHMEAANRAS